MNLQPFLKDVAEWNSYLANVKVNLSRSASNVPKISIRHLSWSINNTTHDSNLPGKFGYSWLGRDLVEDRVLREFTETPGK
jgi:hypothetical protein